MRRLARWSMVAGTAAALVAVAGVVQATAEEQPAQTAAQSADVRVHTTTVSASVNRSKGATVSCHGKAVYGGGARVIGGGGRVSLTRLVPRNTSSGGEYQARAEIAPYYEHDVAWSLEVFAICGAKLPGYRIVSQRATTLEPATYLAVEATCPTGTNLLGTGARVFGSGRAFLGAVKPLGDTRLGVAAHHDPFIDGDQPSEFSVDSIAVCAEPPPNYDVAWVSGASEYASVLVHDRTSACPAGTFAYGVGFSLFAEARHTRVDRMFPLVNSAMRPYAARIRSEQPNLVPDSGWAIHRAAICGS